MQIFKKEDGTYAVYEKEPDIIWSEQEFQEHLQTEVTKARVNELAAELDALGFIIVPKDEFSLSAVEAARTTKRW